MKEWMCNITRMAGFTKGNIYKTGEGGFLIDDDGDRRLSQETYNSIHPGTFTEIVIELENK